MSSKNCHESVNEPRYVQALTLWFVVLIFMQTAPGIDGVLGTALGVFCIALVWVLPVYIAVRLVDDLGARFGSRSG
ncbi:hypothetical protein C5B91_00635 [Haloferax sp. Atlit-10N]|nr:hypothetical protein C5B86_12870 [Haloferax sp. Atlit-19N]RDZ46218.1 hypothetical protein C5B87_00635 [Haloferax sp. Atlit-16N]RDZ60051.1 hypothetical protein C5B91_00635 [Haloferax sp. Atlit-10N]